MAHPYWPLFDLVVRTPRLELRPPTDDDVLALVELSDRGVHDPAWMPFAIPWTDWDPPVRRRNTLQWWWRQRGDWQAEKWILGLQVSEIGPDGTRTVVGAQDLLGDDFARSRTVSTGSWLGRAHQGRGIGKEMRAAVLHLAFAGLGAERAETSAWHDNESSLAVTRALGYRPNGTHVQLRRDTYDTQLDFVLPREDWAAARRDDIEIEGLDACLELFGVAPGPGL
ncbi:MAG: GNAT family N-acetyltransferase [Acidimicrobiales bacterium]|nr:GNAT family N-acetyltransferase [Acidimicrobiales bacterium]